MIEIYRNKGNISGRTKLTNIKGNITIFKQPESTLPFISQILDILPGKLPMNIELNGIILFVEDVDKLKHFYMDHLHLELAEEIPSEWVLLKAGVCELGLHKTGSTPNESSAKFYNNTKLVFETDEDIVALRKRLADHHVVLQEIKTWDNYNYWVCDGEDPEGNVFQLRQKKI